jgi:transposase
MKKPSEAINIVNLDHLGIVAGIIDEMEPEQLNDDRIGRALDKYHQAGTTKLFTAIALKAALKFQVEPRNSAIEAEKVKAGRFILATNILDIKAVSNSEVLSEYKAQQSNERGFRFVKDPLFFTSSVFVKKPERVEAIGMIMGLCLLVYNLAQRKLRQQLSATNERVKNQVKKLTDKPTMRWIFQMFQAVHLVTINGAKQVSNLTEERQDTLRHLGEYCCQYYLMFSSE